MNNRLLKFIAASGLTNLSDGIATVAWAWLASLMTRDAFLIALVPAALRLPWFLFALPAGIVTDRVDRRQLILWMDTLRVAGFTIAAVAIWSALPLAAAPQTGLAQPALFAVLMSAALIVGCAEVFRDNAAQTMLPAIVPKDQLERANGRLWSVELIGNSLIGPAFGAFLIGWFLPAPFLFNMLAYGFAIILTASVSGQYKTTDKHPQHWRYDLEEGWAYLRSVPLLITLALTTGGWNLFFKMVDVAIILHVQENLGMSAYGYGLLFTGVAVGGILGGMFAGRIVDAMGPVRTLQVMLCTTPFLFTLFALSPNGYVLGFWMAVSQFCGLTWNTVSVSYRQRTIPDNLLGRVNSIYRLFAWGMMPLGMVLSGIIVRVSEGPLDRTGALTMPFYVGAFFTGVMVIWAWPSIARGFDQTPQDAC